MGRQSIGCALGAFAFEERDRRTAGNDPQRLLSLPTETSHPSHHAREITKFAHRYEQWALVHGTVRGLLCYFDFHNA